MQERMNVLAYDGYIYVIVSVKWNIFGYIPMNVFCYAAHGVYCYSTATRREKKKQVRRFRTEF